MTSKVSGLQHSNIPLIILLVIVFVSRIPFLFEGYGVEEDSWGILQSAYHTYTTGILEVSRFPGHPAHEFLINWLWPVHSPFIYNGISALFGVIAVAFFALVLRELGFKYYLLAAAGFAFIPVIYISSTYTIDYMETEAFVLMSYYFVLRKKLYLSGILLGLAMACRITSGAMLIPFLIQLSVFSQGKDFTKDTLKIIAPFVLTVVFCFINIYATFGSSFFMYYDYFPYPPFTKILYKETIGVFGLIGMVAITFFIISIFFQKKETQGSLFSKKIESRTLLSWLSVFVLFIIAYFRLPQKSAYMLPIIPYLFFFLAYYLPAVKFKILCFSFMLSPFLFSINLTDPYRGSQYSKHSMIFTVSGQELFLDPLTGPIYSDFTKRKQKGLFVEKVISMTDTIQNKSLIIAGWWYNHILTEMIDRENNDLVKFDFYSSPQELVNYIGDGYKIYYLPEQNVYNDQLYHIQTDSIASPYITE